MIYNYDTIVVYFCKVSIWGKVDNNKTNTIIRQNDMINTFYHKLDSKSQLIWIIVFDHSLQPCIKKNWNYWCVFADICIKRIRGFIIMFRYNRHVFTTLSQLIITLIRLADKYRNVNWRSLGNLCDKIKYKTIGL